MTKQLQLTERGAARLRAAAVILGGAAGFLGIGEAAFNGFVDSLTSYSTSGDRHLFALAAIGLVGGAFVKRRTDVGAMLELAAGIGLLVAHHPVLGSLMLAGTALAVVSIRASAPESQGAGDARADLGSAVSAIGMVGLALLAAAALFFLGIAGLAIGLSGGSSSGDSTALATLALVFFGCVCGAVALLVRRARR
jgi:hypothetical protein